MRRTTLHRIVLLLALLLCLLCACRTQAPQQPSDSPGLSPLHPKASRREPVSALDYETRRRFDRLFLEAVRQKQKEAIDAEYELLRAALDIAPYAPEALYEMAVLKLSYSVYSDTLARAEGDSLLRQAVELDPDNLYYKETRRIPAVRTRP